MEQSNSNQDDSLKEVLKSIQARLEAIENKDLNNSKRPAEEHSEPTVPKVQKLDNINSDSYYEDEFKFCNNSEYAESNFDLNDNKHAVLNDNRDVNTPSTSYSLDGSNNAGISVTVFDITDNITPIMPRPTMEVPDYINAVIKNFKTSVGILGPNFIETEIPANSVAWLKGLPAVQSFIKSQPTKRQPFSSLVVPVVNDKEFLVVWNLIYKNLDFSKVTDNAFRPLKPFSGLIAPLSKIRDALRQNLQTILILNLFVQYCDNESKSLTERYIYDCTFLQFNTLLDALFHAIISAKKSLTPFHLRNLNCMNNFPEPDDIWKLSNNDIITIRRLNASKTSHFKSNFSGNKPFRGSFRSISRGFNFRGRFKTRPFNKPSSSFRSNKDNTSKRSDK